MTGSLARVSSGLSRLDLPRRALSPDSGSKGIRRSFT